MSEPGHWFESDPNWFKHAVFYEIHTRAFFDGNDDGLGDLRGVADKLDYLQWLGIDCIWLLLLYPVAAADGGYDISDFGNVHADYGTVEDLHALVEGAHQRGLRVIADLAMNHTPSIPGSNRRAPTPRAHTATGTSGRIPTTVRPRRGSSSSTRSRRTGRGIRCAASTTGTASSRTSRT